MTTPLDRQDELKRILAVYGSDNVSQIMGLLERQFMVLHNRAQVLLALCGIVISTTGFSGRLIAGSSRLAQGLVIVGVSLVFLAAAVVVAGVLHLRWLTQQPGSETDHGWLLTALEYRDRKTRLYRQAILLLLVGLGFYVAAIGMMLVMSQAKPGP